MTEAVETKNWRTILRNTDYTLRERLVSFYHSTLVTFQDVRRCAMHFNELSIDEQSEKCKSMRGQTAGISNFVQLFINSIRGKKF